MTTPRLAGRRAIVTGAAQGLGLAIAEALTGAGASVAVCDVRREVEDLCSSGIARLAEVTDVTDADAVREFVDHAADDFGGIDLVVNNAGVIAVTDPATASWETTVAAFDDVFAVNARGTYLVGRAAIPHLIAAGGGDIVNVTTDHIHTCGYPVHVGHDDAADCPWARLRRPALGGSRFDVYDASKWAVKGLTNVWAHGLARHGIRVNSFGMGATDTPMLRANLGHRPLPAYTMTPAAVADVLVDLLAEGRNGRSGDCVQLWAGHPTTLPPPGPEAAMVPPRP